MELPKKHDSMSLNHRSATQDFTGFYIYITVKKFIAPQRNKTRKVPPQKGKWSLEQSKEKQKTLNKETSQKTDEN